MDRWNIGINDFRLTEQNRVNYRLAVHAHQESPAHAHITEEIRPVYTQLVAIIIIHVLDAESRYAPKPCQEPCMR